MLITESTGQLRELESGEGLDHSHGVETSVQDGVGLQYVASRARIARPDLVSEFFKQARGGTVSKNT